MTRVEKILRILSTSSWRSAWFRHRVAAGAEHHRALSGLACKTVVDVGANRGQFALMARHCFPGAQIFSFEPLPKPSKVFRRIFDGNTNLRLYNAAISPVRGESTIHVSQRDDSSSLLPIAPLQNEIFSGTEEAGSMTVESGPLSAFINKMDILSPALLKLDVQGFEHQALKGCEDLINCFTHIYVECSFVELYTGQAFADEVITWLHEREFRLQGVYNMSYSPTGKAVQADFLFAHYTNVYRA